MKTPSIPNLRRTIKRAQAELRRLRRKHTPGSRTVRWATSRIVRLQNQLARQERSSRVDVIESMTAFQFRGYKIRVWREERRDRTNDEIAMSRSEVLGVIHDAVEDAPHAGSTHYDPRWNELIAAQILGGERVNAVEVIDDRGDGVVVYADWP